jgi:hypothetical protein
MCWDSIKDIWYLLDNNREGLLDIYRDPKFGMQGQAHSLDKNQATEFGSLIFIERVHLSWEFSPEPFCLI